MVIWANWWGRISMKRTSWAALAGQQHSPFVHFPQNLILSSFHFTLLAHFDQKQVGWGTWLVSRCSAAAFPSSNDASFQSVAFHVAPATPWRENQKLSNYLPIPPLLRCSLWVGPKKRSHSMTSIRALNSRAPLPPWGVLIFVELAIYLRFATICSQGPCFTCSAARYAAWDWENVNCATCSASNMYLANS